MQVENKSRSGETLSKVGKQNPPPHARRNPVAPISKSGKNPVAVHRPSRADFPRPSQRETPTGDLPRGGKKPCRAKSTPSRLASPTPAKSDRNPVAPRRRGRRPAPGTAAMSTARPTATNPVAPSLRQGKSQGPTGELPPSDLHQYFRRTTKNRVTLSHPKTITPKGRRSAPSGAPDVPPVGDKSAGGRD